MALKPTSAAAETVVSSKTKTKKKHFIGQKVKLFVAGEPVLNVLMWGVNHTVNDLSHLPVPVMLLPDDFKAHSKIKVDNHLFSREHLPSHFKFKEYCPLVFRNIRERFGVDDQDYQGSLTKGAPLKSDDQGRFGHRIFCSCDRRLVVKTVSSEDVAEIHNILKRYHQFIVECHGVTLLPQFLGMYKLTVEGVDTFAVVTRNVFGHRLAVHTKYDLKGSTVAREASPKEKAKELPTFKDNDFVSQAHKLQTGDDSKKHFLEKLKRDVEFLATLKMMDYSLLVGIHDVEKAEREGTAVEAPGGNEDEYDRTGGGFFSPGEFDPSVDVYAIKSHAGAAKKEVYFMAIIGILTHYDAKKKAAHAAKTVKHGARADISTVNPEQYSKRFLDFITTILT